MKYSTYSVALGDEADLSLVPFQRKLDYFNSSSITDWRTCEKMKFSNIRAATAVICSLGRRLDVSAWLYDQKIKQILSFITIVTVLAHIGMLDRR